MILRYGFQSKTFLEAKKRRDTPHISNSTAHNHILQEQGTVRRAGSAENGQKSTCDLTGNFFIS